MKWEIKFFSRTDNGKLDKYNSDMIPLKNLPCLQEVSNKKGHIFTTDQFEISVPEAGVRVHMPTKSIWYADNKAFVVPRAIGVILFCRNYKSPGSNRQNIHVGLVNKDGNGKKIIFNTSSGNFRILEIKNLKTPDMPDHEAEWELV